MMPDKIVISHKDLRFVLFEVGLKSKQIDMIMMIIKKEYENKCLECQGKRMVVVGWEGDHPSVVKCSECKGTGVLNANTNTVL